jgi:hypothetical protein
VDWWEGAKKKIEKQRKREKNRKIERKNESAWKNTDNIYYQRASLKLSYFKHKQRKSSKETVSSNIIEGILTQSKNKILKKNFEQNNIEK